MRGGAALARPAAAAAALWLAACSFVFVDGPRRPVDPASSPRCTTGVGAPVADLALAGIASVLTVLFIVKCDPDDTYVKCRPVAIPTGIVALLAVSSASYGGSQVASCHGARRQHELHVAGGGRSPAKAAAPVDPEARYSPRCRGLRAGFHAECDAARRHQLIRALPAECL